MKTIKYLILVLTVGIVGITQVSAKGPLETQKNSILNKGTVQEWKFFDVNTIQCTINSYGPYCDYLRTNSSGLFWPKGTPKTAVYTAGIWLIGKHRPTGALRTAVQDYQTEFQAGPILNTYNTTNNSVSDIGDPTDSKYRIYKVSRKDSVGGNPDYDNWPVDLGAPYTEVNGTPGYQKGADKPFLWGDQVLWCVYNDGNLAQHANVSTGKPMGVEVQTTYFGFDQPGALGNIMFMRWKIINKSDADYDSVFVSMWSDTDLGDANDDFAGVDTIRKMAYVYNGDNSDDGASGYGSKPPANGFVFFQGPRVQGASTDTGLFEGKKLPGLKNLPGTSHAVYINGGGGVGWTDPPLRNAAFTEQAYNYMNGLVGPTGQPFINPQTGQPSKFAFPGDPVTNTGWLPGNSNPVVAQGDARSMISSGPFTLAKGDTQEIVGGFVIAQGADRLNSVSILRLYTSVAQEAFDVNFALASPPPQPAVAVGELPNKIVLNWGNPSQYTATESYNFIGVAKNYKFEGYNIYQLSGPSSTDQAKLLATYDVVNGVKTVLDKVVDSETGLILEKPVAFGNDNGVNRYMIIDKDYFTNTPLANGKPYYYAVTSYAYNSDPNGIISAIPQVLENSKTVITVIPKGVAAGSQLGGSVSQVVKTNRSVNGDDAVKPIILDPSKLTGAQYNVFFNGNIDTINSWGLIRTTLAKGNAVDTVLNNVTDLAGSNASPVVDGIQWKVANPTAGPRGDAQSPRGYSYSPSGNIWFSAKISTDKMDAFGDGNGNFGLAYPTAGNFVNQASLTKPYELKKVEIRFSNTTKQKAYRYLDNVLGGFIPKALFDTTFKPYLKHRGPGFVYQDFVEVPFTVWEVDSLDGSYAPRQLNAGFLERNDTLFRADGSYAGWGKIDGKWAPTTQDNGGKEVLYIFGSTYSADTLTMYTRNPADTANNARFLNLSADQKSVDVMYVLWVRALDSLVSFQEGDKFTITPNYPLLATTSFGVTAPQNVSNDPKLVSANIEKINVFPNPYYANNRGETNVYQRFVTFTNLPQVATIRIINLTGELVKTINHNNTSGFERWDLRNEVGLPVSSGMYVAFIELPNAGNRTLKLAIIQPEERPTR